MRIKTAVLASVAAIAIACGSPVEPELPDAGDAGTVRVDAFVPPGVDGGPLERCTPASMGSTIGDDCSGDGTCDDGCFCNGVERCVDAHCAAGTDPCADAIDCTES